jgi:hypothetical protein
MSRLAARQMSRSDVIAGFIARDSARRRAVPRPC